MRGGYFLVYRKLFDPSSRWHPSRTGESACRTFAWLDLISMARFEPSDGLDQGELYVSVRTLAGRWNWGRTKTADFLNSLADANAVTIRTQTGRKASILKVCNYDTYQHPDENERTQGGHKADTNAVAKRTRRSNKEKNTEITRMFDDRFWAAYPRRSGGENKAEARKAFLALVRNDKVDPELLIAKAGEYRKYCEAKGTDKQYVKMATSWLRKSRGWEEDWTVENGNSYQPELPDLRTLQI